MYQINNEELHVSDFSLDEKIRVLASYVGANGVMHCSCKHEDIDCVVDANTIRTILMDECKSLILHLKDIEDIEPEHAIHIGKISGNEVDRYNNTDLLLIMKAKKLLSGVDKHTPNSCVGNWAEIIDYLKENGYAVPYKGHSLFDLRIAIKTEIK